MSLICGIQEGSQITTDRIIQEVAVQQSWFNVAARKVTSNNMCAVAQSQEHLLRNGR